MNTQKEEGEVRGRGEGKRGGVHRQINRGEAPQRTGQRPTTPLGGEGKLPCSAAVRSFARRCAARGRGRDNRENAQRKSHRAGDKRISARKRMAKGKKTSGKKTPPHACLPQTGDTIRSVRCRCERLSPTTQGE